MAQEQHPDVLQRNAPVDKYERLYRKRRDRQHQHRHQRGRQFSKHHVTRLHRGRQHQFQRLAFPLAADTAGSQRRHDEKQHDKFDRGDERVEIQKLRILDLRRRPDLFRHRIHIKQQSSQLGHEIMAVDLDEERVNDALPYVTNAQIGDSTNEEFLKSLGIANYDICFVTIGGNFQNSLETTCLLKELGGKMVISRAERDVQEKFLLRNGADKVVYPEKMVAKWATIRYTDDHILDYMEVDASHAIFEVEVPKEWIGKTVGKLDIRKKYDINIMAVKDDGKVSMAISADTCFKEDVTLLVLGEYKAIKKCFCI